jgi:hypothetical protein
VDRTDKAVLLLVWIYAIVGIPYKPPRCCTTLQYSLCSSCRVKPLRSLQPLGLLLSIESGCAHVRYGQRPRDSQSDRHEGLLLPARRLWCLFEARRLLQCTVDPCLSNCLGSWIRLVIAVISHASYTARGLPLCFSHWGQEKWLFVVVDTVECYQKVYNRAQRSPSWRDFSG